MKYIDYETKLLGHVEKIAALKKGEYFPPVNAEIDLSNRCQLGCEWCHFGYTHSRGPLARKDNAHVGDLMETDLAMQIIEQLADAQVKSITWTGGGEPLLHPAAVAIFTHAKSCMLDQGIYTNGVGIDESMSARLNALMKWVYVSLDAWDAKSYKASKGVDAFDKACQGARLAAGGPATLGIGFLLTGNDYQAVPKMLRVAESCMADYVQFRPAIEFDNSNPSVPSDQDRSWIDRIPRPHSTTIQVEWDEKRFQEYRNWTGHGYQNCYWSAMQTVITPDGRVWTCCNKRGFESACLGDLKEEPFEDIWRRHQMAPVGCDCRVMCRGHMPNKVISNVLKGHVHSNFI